MSTRRILARSLVVVVLSASALSCGRSYKLNLRDSEARSFSATCRLDGNCALSSNSQPHPSAPSPEKAKPGFVQQLAGRVFLVCDAWMRDGQASSVNPADCRPLVCSQDDDCPHANAMSHGTCTNTLCIEPTGPITVEDAIALCEAGTGAPSGSTQQIERFALGNNCGTPCKVPSVCRQP